jgi:hypothetical protein
MPITVDSKTRSASGLGVVVGAWVCDATFEELRLLYEKRGAGSGERGEGSGERGRSSRFSGCQVSRSYARPEPVVSASSLWSRRCSHRLVISAQVAAILRKRSLAGAWVVWWWRPDFIESEVAQASLRQRTCAASTSSPPAFGVPSLSLASTIPKCSGLAFRSIVPTPRC